MANGTAGHAWNGKDDVDVDSDSDSMNEAGRVANKERERPENYKCWERDNSQNKRFEVNFNRSTSG